MSESSGRWPPRPELLRSIRRQIGDLGSGLRVVAQEVLGAEGAIDLLAVDPEGRVVVVMVAKGGEQLEVLARGLAHRGWVAPRVRDWLQLAPSLELRPDVMPRLLLLAPCFDARTLTVARWIDAEGIDLVLYRPSGAERGFELALEALPFPDQGAALGTGPRPGRSESRFWTGLSEADLALTPAESQAFD